ncbi:MAG: ATP-binding protein, partial [Chloroflexota bacterium]|nr:ATP-binding protein [Chloroflexota bacterium]
GCVHRKAAERRPTCPSVKLRQRREVRARASPGPRISRDGPLGPHAESLAPSPGCLVVVAGLPGSGKTTQSKRLERERPGVRFCPDDWMSALGVSLWDGEVRARIESLQWEMAAQVLRAKGTAIIEWGTWGRDEREPLHTEAQALGARTELLYISTSRSTSCGAASKSAAWRTLQ